MNFEELESNFAQYIQDQVNHTEREIKERINNLVKDYLENHVSTDSLFADSAAEAVRNYADRYISNEIGNRLRCGVYDYNIFKKVFDDNWEKCLKTQIESEIRTEIRKVIKAEIQIYIKEILGKL